MPRQDRLSWELGNSALEGWTGDATAAISLIPHQDAQGFGGIRHGGTGAGSPRLPESRDFKDGPSAEVIVRCYMRADGADNDGEGRFTFLASNGAEIGSVRYTEVDELLKIYTGPSTLVATSLSTLVPDAYHRIEVRWFMADGGSGSVEVFVDDDGSYSTPFVEFSGDTKPGAETQLSRIRFYYESTLYIDDAAINTIGVRYDGGTGGAPAVGETLTDATTTNTAVVESVNGDATSGYLIISQVSGPFGDNNQVTSSGTFDALVVAPTADFVDGLMPHSSFPDDGVIVYQPPNGNGTTSDLTGDDGNQVDNYLRVDDLPIDDTNEHVAGDTTLQLDTYLKPSLPISAAVVRAVETVHSSQKDGTTINNARHVLRFDGTDYTPADSEYALPNDWEINIHTWDTKPDGAGAFSVADVDAAGTEPGFQVRT